MWKITVGISHIINDIKKLMVVYKIKDNFLDNSEKKNNNILLKMEIAIILKKTLQQDTSQSLEKYHHAVWRHGVWNLLNCGQLSWCFYFIVVWRFIWSKNFNKKNHNPKIRLKISLFAWLQDFSNQTKSTNTSVAKYRVI